MLDMWMTSCWNVGLCSVGCYQIYSNMSHQEPGTFSLTLNIEGSITTTAQQTDMERGGSDAIPIA